MKDLIPGDDLLQPRSAPEDEDTRDETYGGVWERLKGRTQEMVGQAHRRREEVERLLRELLAAEPSRQLRMIREPRFQSLALLDWLLEQSHEHQLSNPAQAAQLARLAIRLGTGFKETAAARDWTEAVAALPRAFCLGANALRLDSRLSAAESLLARGSLFLADSSERAFYCRTLAVLRWEQARTDEARALLVYAAGLYAREEVEGEASLCRGLLGLILLEVGGADALGSLSRSWPGLDREARPLVALRVGLALVAALAQAGQPERARQVLAETWKLYVSVTDSQEMDRVFWWEGRALANLGDREPALALLESVRRQLLAEPSPGEAALASIDLAVTLAEVGRRSEIAGLAQSLREAFPEIPVLELAAEGILSLAVQETNHAITIRQAGTVIESTLRRAFRICGVAVRPFPVA
jgi:hypothetical protein